MSSEPRILIHHSHDKNTPIVTGCPFPARVDLSHGAVVQFENGKTTHAQAVQLTNATSTGVRWWELSFLSTCEGQASVTPAKAAPSGAALCSGDPADRVLLDNSLIRVEISSNASEPLRIHWAGGSGTITPQVDVEEFGACREQASSTRSINVLRNGPTRAQVEITSQLVSPKGQVQSRITLEIWRDQPGLRVDWMLTNLVPGRLSIHVTRATLQGDWNVGAQPRRVFRQQAYSNLWIPRDVTNPDAVTLIADTTASTVHVSDPAMLLDDSEYPFYCAPPVVTTHDWLELAGDAGRVSAQLVDFTQTRPNALRSESSGLSYDMVPVGHTLNWCQGWRKEQHLLLSFASAADDLAPSKLAARAAAMFALGRAQPAPATLRELRCFELDRILHYEPGKCLRLSAILAHLCNLFTPGSKFDLGDTPDWHYTRGYAAAANQYLPMPGAEDWVRRLSAEGRVFPDIVKFFLEPVWTNNEYDIIHAIATETLRTGKDDHFEMLRWTSRHNVEIDFISYSDDRWHHRASPFHSHFHNRKGAITSHFWTQGLLQYYCLTGDRDAREVALALGDKIIEFNKDEGGVRTWAFDREVGWALLALTCLAEAGFSQYLDEAATIATYLRNYDRSAFSGAVKLSAGKAGRSLERQMVDAGFGYSSMVEALDRYQVLTQDPKTKEWYEELLLQLKDAFWEKVADGEQPGIRNMTGLVMAIGYERTGDTDFLTAGQLLLETYLDPAGPSDPTGTEGGQIKPNAMAYRGLHRLLGALDRAGLLDQYEYSALRHRKESRKQAPVT